MFTCTQCVESFTLKDVEKGLYFPSTSTCLSCYKTMARSRVRCFGKEKMYNNQSIACQECPDSLICKTYIKHRKEF